MLLLPLSCALHVVAAATGVPSGGETTVEFARPAEVDDDRITLGDGVFLAAPEEALLQGMGTELVRDGGPLAPARAMVRGLSGARVGADMSGLDLVDPSTGLVDAAALPFLFAEGILVESGAGPGGSARLRFSPARTSGVRARVTAGSLATARAALSAREQRDGSSTLVAAEAGFTRGDFRFAPTSATNGAGDGDASNTGLLIREGNDQRRASAFFHRRSRLDDVTVETSALAQGHEGGIPGLATSPRRSLRGDDGFLGARVAAERRVGPGVLRLGVDGRGAQRSTDGPDDGHHAIESLATGADLGAERLGIGGDVFLDVGVRAGHARLADGSFERTSASTTTTAHGTLGPIRWRAACSAHALTDLGLLTGGELRGEIGRDWIASVSLARASRPPTLDELYAPRGLVLGNPNLRAEILDDLELAIGYRPGRLLDVRVVAFAGLIEDAIVYVNKNAYEVAPLNLGRSSRAGIDTSVVIEPNPGLGLELVSEALWSRVEESQAPLPLAPPFHSRVALRVGPRSTGHVTATLRSRGAASSNLYGTLVAPGYSMLDLAAHAPLAQRLTLGIVISNVFDVLDARDANQLPLPGRLLFLSLEVRG